MATCLICGYDQLEDGIDAHDITISILRETKPVNLFQWFKSHGYKIEQKYDGIYYET